MQSENVLVHVENNVGFITLNRPNVLNSLNLEMVEQLNSQLKTWQTDENVVVVCLTGAGEKGFCAGGDMRSLYELKESGVTEVANQFFTTEYELDLLIHEYPKPILVYMNGIVMGGGVGLSIGSKFRFVTERTKWAMPEMNIGFFPDVGASYFLNHMPGAVGTYLALTAAVLKPEDVLYIGAADYHISTQNWEDLKQSLLTQTWSLDTAEVQLVEILTRFTSKPDRPSAIASLQDKINLHFSKATVEEIVQSLHAAAQSGDEWAGQTKEILMSKSPISLKVALSQIQKGKALSLAECFQMERILGVNFMHNPDFYEGVRAVLVDKDQQPNWQPETLEQVSDEAISFLFQERK